MGNQRALDDWLRERLVCPRDKSALRVESELCRCERGHTYPIVDGIPIMLLPEVDPDLGIGSRTLEQVASGSSATESVKQGEIDAYVQRQVAGTCGRMYRPVIGKLTRYPIPEIRLPGSEGARLLDIGCGWGRWSIAAARKGYRPVGIDASLDAVRAARRVAEQLNEPAAYVVGDARYLPFSEAEFETVFSYSFLIHLSKADVGLCLREIARVLAPGGTSLIEMPNAFAPRNFLIQMRRGFRDPGGFGVRYWRPSELESSFTRAIGPSSLSADSYFFINGQPSDRDILPRRYRMLIAISESLRHLSGTVEALKLVADSLYVHSEVAKPAPSHSDSAPF